MCSSPRPTRTRWATWPPVSSEPVTSLGHVLRGPDSRTSARQQVSWARWRHTDPLVLVVAAVSVVVYTLHGFHGALTRDLGVYSYAGQQVADGVAPYVGILNRAGPLAHVLPGVGVLIARVGGFDDLLTMRVLFMLIATACVATTYLLGRDLFRSRGAGLVSAGTLLAFHGFIQYASNGPREKTPMTLFIICALWALTRRWWFTAGVFVSLATLCLQTAFFSTFVAVVVGALLIAQGGRLRALGRIALGGLVPMGVLGVWFALAGSLGAAIDGFVDHQLALHGAEPGDRQARPGLAGPAAGVRRDGVADARGRSGTGAVLARSTVATGPGFRPGGARAARDGGGLWLPDLPGRSRTTTRGRTCSRCCRSRRSVSVPPSRWWSDTWLVVRPWRWRPGARSRPSYSRWCSLCRRGTTPSTCSGTTSTPCLRSCRRRDDHLHRGAAAVGAHRADQPDALPDVPQRAAGLHGPDLARRPRRLQAAPGGPASRPDLRGGDGLAPVAGVDRAGVRLHRQRARVRAGTHVRRWVQRRSPSSARPQASRRTTPWPGRKTRPDDTSEPRVRGTRARLGRQRAAGLRAVRHDHPWSRRRERGTRLGAVDPVGVRGRGVHLPLAALDHAERRGRSRGRRTTGCRSGRRGRGRGSPGARRARPGWSATSCSTATTRGSR